MTVILEINLVSSFVSSGLAQLDPDDWLKPSREAAKECSPQPALSEVEGAQAVGKFATQ